MRSAASPADSQDRLPPDLTIGDRPHAQDLHRRAVSDAPVFGCVHSLLLVPQVGDLAKEFEALLDFIVRQRCGPVGAEHLTGKRSHDAAIEERPAKDGRSKFRLRGEVAVEASCETIACAGGIDEFSERQRGRPERMLGLMRCGERVLAKKTRLRRVPHA